MSVGEREAWMETYSFYGRGMPHGFEHIIRETEKFGTEYFFSPTAFERLTLR
jgi:hypothetical protein